MKSRLGEGVVKTPIPALVSPSAKRRKCAESNYEHVTDDRVASISKLDPNSASFPEVGP